MNTGKTIVVIGGGAAGFFSAIAAAESRPYNKVIILEKSSQLLQKVKISGGGRCNVTHHCFDPNELIKNYPRGGKELLGPFTKFGPGQTVDWFREKGVKLKAEQDGRMFPVSDSSQTIIDCFLHEAARKNIVVRKQAYVNALEFLPDKNKWKLAVNGSEILEMDSVIITTGSSDKMWNILNGMGVEIIPPVPSLFTFNIKDERLRTLEGLSVPNACVSVAGDKLSATGPLLITHWGLSGPAVLKLSSWGSRLFAAKEYNFTITVNWTNNSNATIKSFIVEHKRVSAKKNVHSNALFDIPKRLWQRLAASATIEAAKNFGDLTLHQVEQLTTMLTACKLEVAGKATFKEEFVTAGGVDLKEVDFKSMQLKKQPGLFIAGEALNIDAITGGFNFQAAWTTGWIAGNSV